MRTTLERDNAGGVDSPGTVKISSRPAPDPYVDLTLDHPHATVHCVGYRPDGNRAKWVWMVPRCPYCLLPPPAQGRTPRRAQDGPLRGRYVLRGPCIGGEHVTTTDDRQFWSADALAAESFPDPRFAVAEIIPEGLTLLIGPPKIGKSWLVWDLAFHVASGTQALGKYDTEQGGVLYLALEDNARRLQDRLRIVANGAPVPSSLHLATAWPSVDDGGLNQLRSYLKQHPDTRMIVVDVLARMRPSVEGRAVYQADYRAATNLKAIADEYNLAMVVNHHDRKESTDDFVEKVSGSHGLAGAADAVAVIQRTRGQADATLRITGRDVAEVDKALKFDAGRWLALDGPSEVWGLESTSRKIVTFLRDHPGSGPKAVAEGVEITEDNAKKTLQRLAGKGRIDQRGRGRYFSSTPVPSVPSSPS